MLQYTDATWDINLITEVDVVDMQHWRTAPRDTYWEKVSSVWGEANTVALKNIVQKTNHKKKRSASVTLINKGKRLERGKIRVNYLRGNYVTPKNYWYESYIHNNNRNNNNNTDEK